MQELDQVAPVLVQQGAVSPSWRSSALIWPGVGLEPNSRICAGLPGMTCRIKNTSTVMPSSTGTVTRSRRTMKLIMAGASADRQTVTR